LLNRQNPNDNGEARGASVSTIPVPGLVPGTHVLVLKQDAKDVDGRDKPGHGACFGPSVAKLLYRAERKGGAFGRRLVNHQSGLSSVHDR
jgi:hypothetical protein